MRQAVARCARVLIADDHPSIRENLRYLINAEADLECVGVVKPPSRCVQMCRELLPDVLVLDDDMPGVDAIATLRTVSREMPETRIVMYTLDVGMCEVARAFGADACVAKDDSYDSLLLAIRDRARAIPVSA